ncbi:MAG: exopolysaccharide biosynthesis polyprenyl glycosylphosphotransferase [Bacteroides sp.]|uniref:exopolysaccharide biosynthesis polyprenyl glycosylphosphotransferase n=1 Tax=Bacteroides sp. TaxID=29523 RepID=UPI0026E01DEF|nr:exopolysaccharide biosynthesis polyprenyl glycosylphosphotransferase [Bacteroides sp.]MDO5419487.1 exopolysaccharide biosynthesis polyprenyl glycosylphosphotransferase [Bacteroides sp.]
MQLSIKRFLDILVSLILLILILPLWVILVVIIETTSPGRAVFTQKRTGLHGRTFVCYKFRTMYLNKEADTLQATCSDKRITKIGGFLRRTSMDELPQLFNVLKGDMSLIGPRPHMLKHTELYSQLIPNYMERHRMRPGLTGYAQIKGLRGETSELKQMQNRVEADLFYVEHFSLGLDMKILWITAMKVLTLKL